MSDVQVYANGIVCCSVCAPEGMPVELIEEEVNLNNPTGISSPWRVSDDEAFATGEPHPHPCEQVPGRLHYLLNC